MPYNFQKINFDIIFKTMLLILVAYFLVILTKISNNMQKESEVGRYIYHPENNSAFDTKTGKLIPVE